MNVYKILFKHYAPKGSDHGIKCLLLAPNEEAVFNWIASDPKLREGQGWINSIWKDKVDDFEDATGDKWDDVDHKDFKSRMLFYKGEIDDPGSYADDAYYGVTHYGWAIMIGNVTEDWLLPLSDILYHHDKQGREAASK